MSASGGASLNSHDNEIGGYGEAEFSKYECPEEDSGSNEFLYPRWRRVPRAPSDFIESKTSISSCKDSDYERWLEQYYNELVAQDVPHYSDCQVDTSDLKTEIPSEVVPPLFPSIPKDRWTGSTKYWGPKEVRRHWVLRKNHREYLFFPSIYPDLNLRSRYGRYHSLLHTAAAVPEVSHKKLVCNMFKKIVDSLVVKDPKLMKVWYCENLYNLKWFDYMTKIAIIRCLCKFFRTQHLLEKVYIENACLKRLEAIILLCALSRSGGDYLKELHIWQMFGYGQCPLLMSELPESVNKFGENKSMEFFTKIHYLQILYKFSALTHLSVNYAYLANPDGDALLCLKSIRSGSMKELRILCLKDERPFLTNPAYGVGGWSIPDGVWRRAVEWCPELRVKFVFMNMPQYENIILFLSKNIPVSYVYISSGMDFNFETPWDVDSTLLELRNWYAPTLETLCLHLWHHRDLLDFVIKHKILEEFPNLINFEFIGVLEDVETLNSFCCQLSKGIYKIKTFLFWVEDRHTNRKKLNITRKRVEEIREYYKRKFVAVDIDADIKTYAL